MEYGQLIIKGQTLNFVIGKTYYDWLDEFGSKDEEDELWDFDIKDFIEGAVEPQEGMTYWYIDGRLYETFSL